MLPRSAFRIFTLLLSLSLSLPSFGLKPDVKQAQITRTADNAASVSTQLSLDVYRTETYEDNYTVQVPYDFDETYYVDVPYQDLETYTDYEEYWDRERVCRDKTEWEDKCDTRRKCEPKYERRCETKRVCSVRLPGLLNALVVLYGSYEAMAGGKDRNDDRGRDNNNNNNDRDRDRDRDRGNSNNSGNNSWGHGDNRGNNNGWSGKPDNHDRDHGDNNHDRDHGHGNNNNHDHNCRDVQQCDNVRVGEDCRDVRECRKVSHNITKCEMEDVRKTRPVLKQRWVTHYRQEQRTRTVTRYRDEIRCCVTKTRSVFDHTYTADVELQFPAAASLDAGEKETFSVSLANDGIIVDSVAALYTYVPRIERNGDRFTVQMDLVPTYGAGALGADTMSGFELSEKGDKARLTFSDKGVVPKVQTQYKLTLTGADGQQLFQGDRVQAAETAVSWELPVALQAKSSVTVRLEVVRQGAVLVAPVSFAVDNVLTVADEDPVYDPALYMDANRVGKFSLAGNGAAFMLYFRDMTDANPAVVTEYTVKVSIGSTVIVNKAFSRGAIPVTADGRTGLSVKDLGMSSDGAQALVAGTPITVSLTVRRSGKRLPKSPFVMTKGADLIVR